MSFPRYPEYKDSGVEWLGEVPAHWETLRLKQVVSADRPITYGIVQAGENVEGGIPYIRPADMLEEDGVRSMEGLLKTSREIAASYSRSSLSAGDIVCSIGPSFGKLMLVPEELSGANLTQGTARVAIDEQHVRKYFFWALRAPESFNQWESSVGGATFRALNLGPLADTRVLSPRRSEQAAIAAFLDYETARIDALVEEQQRLIELLKEKRQAVISHAVTKGLDPGVPMKDSGVEWLGEVPAHWDTLPIKRDLEFLTSGSRGWASHYSDDGAAFIRIGNLTRDNINLDFSDLQRVSVPEGSEGERTKIKEHDLLFSITAYLGSVAVVPTELETAYVSQHIALARLFKERLLPRWVAYVTLSDVGKNYLSSQGYGGTKVQLSLEDVAELLVTAPPLDEQAAITSFLDHEIARIDALAEEGDSVIKLLQERRSALISAAVTGKIDVRGWQPPAGSSAPAETTQMEAI